ncbi:protein-cysteine N-palmitoyltransferase Rasp isoform X2 [Zootermopsis nevadensis]|uniref:Protein-cysteine N-palmitoyltransferase Rasp n=1 Tax=Zootermopsis nevadensis TaxID=136037 RepID=A0A067R3L2_ZOONE|nr:protein-cysteine N-palmitoyltransferase Rasp isoform X2 [Zootermopsis nevadensis]KDR12454.1 Protein-cysteine N-palmitoyltransferase Rasp [Zootermopsis nevadensis]
MYCNLPKVEVWAYFVLWIFGILYSMYNVYLSGIYFGSNSHSHGVFTSGWSFINHKKDVSDFEWSVWAPFLYTSAPWVCVHLVVAEFVRYAFKELLAVWYLTISMLYLLLHVGLPATLFMLMEPCLMYFLLQFRSRVLIYVAGLFLLVFHNVDTRMNFLSISYVSQYMLMISSAWIYMRSQSFCLDRLSSASVRPSASDLMMMLGYCFYFPMMFLGPLVICEEFEAGLQKPYAPWTIQRVKTFALGILRYSWWMLFLELFLHFIYVSALQMELQYVTRLGAWAHYGMGYSMGIMFQMKYIVTYGLSCTVARAEQIQTPNHPKCIGRIHLYSDMWRYFDQGLYFFLRKYIYVPILGESRSFTVKLLASFACFVFICAWHRIYMFVLIWSLLNYLGVTIEAVSKAIASTTHYQKYENFLLSTPQNIRRFHAFIATPLFIMSAVSNFYFFAGMSIGNQFVKRLLEGSLQQNSILFFFCYCCSQVSIEVKNWELRKQKKIP